MTRATRQRRHTHTLTHTNIALSQRMQSSALGPYTVRSSDRTLSHHTQCMQSSALDPNAMQSQRSLTAHAMANALAPNALGCITLSQRMQRAAALAPTTLHRPSPNRRRPSQTTPYSLTRLTPSYHLHLYGSQTSPRAVPSGLSFT